MDNHRKPWTKQDDLQLSLLWKAGATPEVMSKSLSRFPPAIATRSYKLGLRKIRGRPEAEGIPSFCGHDAERHYANMRRGSQLLLSAIFRTYPGLAAKYGSTYGSILSSNQCSNQCSNYGAEYGAKSMNDAV